MSGGGKHSTSTSSVSIPPEVLARYNAVNARAEEAATQPFTPYTGEFVAPLTATQQAGIANINQSAAASQPYYGAATQALLGGQAQAQPYYEAATSSLTGGLQAAGGLQQQAAQNIGAAQAGAQPYQALATGFGLAGAQAVQPGGLNIGQYMSPYVGAVAAPTYAALRQQQQQEQQRLLGDQIKAGAFGGDRGRIAAANLAQQQDLATAQAMGNIYQQGYGQALGAAQQQQQIGLTAEQANRQALQQAAQQFLGIGQQGFGQGMTTAQQQAALAQQQFGQGATASQQQQALGQGLYGIGAGVSQGLAGLGAGSQQTALQGAQAQLAAGTVEQQTQQARDQALYNQFLQQQGYPFQVAQFLANIAMGTGAQSGSTTTARRPTSFFGVATGGAVKQRAYGGGLVNEDASMGGGVFREDAGLGYADGGPPGGSDVLAQINALVNTHQGMYPYGKAGLYGSINKEAGPYGSTLMPAGGQRLMTAPPPERGPSGMQQVNAAMQQGQMFGKLAEGARGGLGQASLSEGYKKAGGKPETVADYADQAGKWLDRQFSSEPNASAGYRPGDVTRAELPPSTDLVPAEVPVSAPSNFGFSLPGADVPSIVPFARGGAARDGYAMGGMPYSEAAGSYVPVDLTQPEQPKGLNPPKIPEGQEKSGFQQTLDAASKMAAIAALALSRGGVADRHGYEDGGAPEVPEEWRPHLRAASERHGIPESALAAVARQESRFGRADPKNPMQIIERTARDPGYGVSPISLEDRGRLDVAVPWAAQYIAARNPNVDWTTLSRPEMAQRLASTYNAGGDPNYASNILRYMPGVTPEEMAQTRGARASAPAGLAGASPQGDNRSVRAWADEAKRGLDPNDPEYAQKIMAINNRVISNLGGRPQPVAGLASADKGQGDVIPTSGPGDQMAGGLAGAQKVGNIDYQGKVLEALQPIPREPTNWFQKNQDWMVPLLTGLGTMVSSPSRYLGTALVQGLAGGAQSYAGMQRVTEDQLRAREALGVNRAQALIGQQREQNVERQLQENLFKRTLDQFGQLLPPDGRFPNGKYLDTETGQYVSPEQRWALAMRRVYGGMPAAGAAPVAPGARVTPPGIGAPPSTTQPPSPADVPAPKPVAAPVTAPAPAPGTTPTGTQIEHPVTPETNPVLMQREAAGLLAEADKVSSAGGFSQRVNELRERANNLIQRAKDIEQGRIPATGTNNNPYWGYKTLADEAERRNKSIGEEEQAALAHAQTGSMVESNLKRAAELLSRTPVGRSGETISFITNVATSLPGGAAFVPEFMKAIQATDETAKKLALEQAFAKLQAQAQAGTGRQTNLALIEMMQTVADPGRGPAAQYEVITRSLAQKLQDDAWYSSLSKKPANMPLYEWRQQFDKQNPFDSFVDKSKAGMAGFAGMTPEIRRQYRTADSNLPDNLRNPTTYNPLAPYRERVIDGQRQFLMGGKIYDQNGRQLEGVTP